MIELEERSRMRSCARYKLLENRKKISPSTEFIDNENQKMCDEAMGAALNRSKNKNNVHCHSTLRIKTDPKEDSSSNETIDDAVNVTENDHGSSINVNDEASSTNNDDKIESKDESSSNDTIDDATNVTENDHASSINGNDEASSTSNDVKTEPKD